MTSTSNASAAANRLSRREMITATGAAAALAATAGAQPRDVGRPAAPAERASLKAGEGRGEGPREDHREDQPRGMGLAGGRPEGTGSDGGAHPGTGGGRVQDHQPQDRWPPDGVRRRVASGHRGPDARLPARVRRASGIGERGRSDGEASTERQDRRSRLRPQLPGSRLHGRGHGAQGDDGEGPDARTAPCVRMWGGRDLRGQGVHGQGRPVRRSGRGPGMALRSGRRHRHRHHLRQPEDPGVVEGTHRPRGQHALGGTQRAGRG